jgi:predicted ArsR family transcriptional regulator
MAPEEREDPQPVGEADVALDRDTFFRSMLRGLSGTLEDIVGLDEAAGFVSVVGDRVGRGIDAEYREALDTPTLSREQTAEVLVDLKRRIGGDFYVIEQSDDRIVLGNRACPFGEKVLGRSSLCMMTSNVFGVIASENLGYARVDLQETIAQGAPGCRVVVHLRPSEDPALSSEREYYSAEPRQDSAD